MSAHVLHIDPDTGPRHELADAVGAVPAGTGAAGAVGSAPAGGAPRSVHEPTGGSAVVWEGFARVAADEACVMTERDDLIVTVAPGAGRGAPACFLPTLATIELDAAHLAGIDPDTATPDHDTDRHRYPAGWGLLVHECAHARHSRWDPPDGIAHHVGEAAMLLEESRIEHHHLARRPTDRLWLRAASSTLILADVLATPDPCVPDPSALDPSAPGPVTPDPATPTAPSPITTAPITTAPITTAPITTAGAMSAPSTSAGGRVEAAQMAGLLLARVDAGVLTADDVAPVRHRVVTILGGDTLTELQGLWQAAHRLSDTDTDAMLDLGRRWCATVGTDTTDTTDTTDLGGTADRTDSRPDNGSGGTATSGEAGAGEAGAGEELRRVAVGVLARLDRQVEREVAAAAAADPTAVAASAAADDAKDAARAARAARTVFATDPAGDGGGAWSRVSGTRPPTARERVAARRVGRVLSSAGVPDRVRTTTSSMLPPGRLRMRGALAADAQRAAGATPTAEPFTRTHRATVPEPPLRLGIACDISGSMAPFAAPVASAAWILATATRHTRVPAHTASVLFGRTVHPLVAPGAHPALVAQFEALDDYEAAGTALEALDGALQLSRPGAARLLVIVSDGHWRPAPRHAAQTRVDTLRRSGCGVLWLAPDPRHGSDHPLTGATVIELADPATTADTIARAATNALRAAARTHP
jgi:hypothetical protein